MGAQSYRKRGRLSSIDTLPEWAEEAKLWAFAELKERKLTQLEILDGFNERLKTAAWENGVTKPPQISRSAFNRRAVRMAVMGSRLAEVAEIATAINEGRKPEDDDHLTVMVASTIKTLIFELIEGDPNLSPKQTMEMARALQAAVSAQNISTARRRKVEAEFAQKAGEAINLVGKEQGLSADQIKRIRRDVLGVRS